MKSPIERMLELIPFLPEKDIPLGYKFIESRDFESLKMLVDSAVVRVNKNNKRENPKKEYLNADLSKINILKIEVDNYYNMLNIY